MPGVFRTCLLAICACLAEDKLRQDQPELAKRRDDALRLKREKILDRGRDKELVQTFNQER